MMGYALVCRGCGDHGLVKESEDEARDAAIPKGWGPRRGDDYYGACLA